MRLCVSGMTWVDTLLVPGWVSLYGAKCLGAMRSGLELVGWVWEIFFERGDSYLKTLPSGCERERHKSEKSPSVSESRPVGTTSVRPRTFRPVSAFFVPLPIWSTLLFGCFCTLSLRPRLRQNTLFQNLQGGIPVVRD